MRPIRLQSSQQNRPYKTINTASYHIVIQSTSFLYYNVAWKGGSFTFPFYPLWIVSICFTQTPPTHFIKIKWAKDLSFCHTKRRKKRRFSSSEIVPLFSKTMDERTKNLSYFVCSSTKNMRTVWLHSILFLQVKSIESSLDDSTKKVVVFGRLLSSKHSLPKINLV